MLMPTSSWGSHGACIVTLLLFIVLQLSSAHVPTILTAVGVATHYCGLLVLGGGVLSSLCSVQRRLRELVAVIIHVLSFSAFFFLVGWARWRSIATTTKDLLLRR